MMNSISPFSLQECAAKTSKNICGERNIALCVQELSKTMEPAQVWEKVFQEFRNIAKVSFKNTFVQENKQQHLAMVSFLGFPEVKMTKYQMRQIVYDPKAQHFFGSAVVDLFKGKIVSAFKNKSAPYDSHELGALVKDVAEVYTKRFTVVATQIPVGITLQLGFHNDWNISTRTILRMNDSKLIGETPLMEKFTDLLGKYGIQLDDLDKGLIYTFHLIAQEYSIVKCEDNLLFVKCFGNVKLLSEETREKISKMPTLCSIRFDACPEFAQLCLINNRYDEKRPQQSLLVEMVVKGGLVQHSLEINTDLGQLLEKVRTKGANKEQQLKNLKEFIVANPQNKFVTFMNE